MPASTLVVKGSGCKVVVVSLTLPVCSVQDRCRVVSAGTVVVKGRAIWEMLAYVGMQPHKRLPLQEIELQTCEELGFCLCKRACQRAYTTTLDAPVEYDTVHTTITS